jgi:hypothetical protein
MIVRDSDVGMQVFMMKRSLKSNFGGIWVFPGGILEDQDQDIAKKELLQWYERKKGQAILNYDRESLTYWIASLRETLKKQVHSSQTKKMIFFLFPLITKLPISIG